MKLAWIAVALLAAAAPQKPEPAPREVRATALRKAFDELAESGLSGAVLVSAGDDVLLDAACGLADRAHGRVNQTDTLFDVGSLTKQFTATAILQLEEQKKLSTSDTLEHFFEGVPADKKRIQLHHLLTHTSGLPRDVPVGSETTERKDLVRASFATPLESKPGEKFLYANANYELLAAVVEVASGQSYETYVAEHLFGPAGMRSSGFLQSSTVDATRTARGYEGQVAFGPAEKRWYSWGLRGAGGVLSTTRDLWLWSKAIQTDAVLSKREREKLFTPFQLDYAYGWWVRQDAKFGKLIEHGGTTKGFEAWLAHYVDHDLRVIVLCNDLGRRELVVSEMVEAALADRAAPADVALTAQQMGAFAGKYESLRGGLIVVRADGDALTIEPDREVVIGLIAGEGSTKLASDPRAKKRAEKLIDFLSAADATGAATLLSDEWGSAWKEGLLTTWRAWIDARGKLTHSECLGTLGSGGTAQTLLALVHERRSVIWALSWKDELLHGWDIDGGLPEGARYRPRSATEFTFEDKSPYRTRSHTLAFDVEPSGTVRGFSYTSNVSSMRISAKRQR